GEHQRDDECAHGCGFRIVGRRRVSTSNPRNFPTFRREYPASRRSRDGCRASRAGANGSAMGATTFEAIEAEFLRRVNRTVWCSVATLDARDRLRTRILHPLWERSTGWILTARQSAKAKDLAHNATVSCAYWDQDQEQVHADCRATWEESLAEKRRLWELF